MKLWMRWVNFRALRDLLLLVKASPGQLRATDLTRLTSEKRLLIGRKGQVLGPSSHYHHRRTLERFGLLVKKDYRYALAGDIKEVKPLTEQQSIGATLADQERAAFSNVVLRNKDCHDVFFRYFLKSDDVSESVNDFIERARPIELRVIQDYADLRRKNERRDFENLDAHMQSKQVAIRSLGSPKWSMFSGTNAVQAIHFGIRAWCVDQLFFLDGMYGVGGVFTLYPKRICQSLTANELALGMLDSLQFKGEWATVRVGDFALQMGIRHQATIEQTKGVLSSWMTHYPDVVAAIPTNERFITGGLADGQRGLILKGFLLRGTDAYVSHLRIHRDLQVKVRRSLTPP